MKEKNIQVTVKIEPQDYENFNALFKIKLIYMLYGILVSAAIQRTIERDTVGVILSIIIYGGIIYGYNFLCRLEVKKSFKSNKRMQKEEKFTITSNGIEIIKTDGSEISNIKWDELYGAKQGEDIIVLMMGKASGHIIPKRLLNQEQLIELEALIKDKLGSKEFKNSRRFIYLIIGILIYIVLEYMHKL